MQENELWDKESNHSIGSWVPPTKMMNDGYAESRTASIYGRETVYEPAMSRAYSPAPSQAHMMFPPPGYHSGHNTPTHMSVVGFPNAGVPPTASFYQPTPSRPASNYIGVDIPRTGTPEQGGFFSDAQGPSDAEIDRAVEDILRDADLATTTKREIRSRLEQRFGMDLSSRKRVVNEAIDRVLLARAG